jgi:pimeloyl-ACP methyl ester carboxylesterase
LREGEDARALAALSRGLRIPSAEQIRTIKTPLSVIIGADDLFISDAQRLSRAVAHTEMVTIPAVDHEMAIWHPKFADALLAFLLKHSAMAR